MTRYGVQILLRVQTLMTVCAKWMLSMKQAVTGNRVEFFQIPKHYNITIHMFLDCERYANKCCKDKLKFKCSHGFCICEENLPKAAATYCRW